MPTWPIVQKSSRLHVNKKTSDFGNLEFYFSFDQSGLTVAALIWIASTLTLKAPIMTAADDKFWDIFPNFLKK